MLTLTVKGLVTYDSGQKIYKTEKADYPWRQIKVCVPGNSVDFPISVYPTEEIIAGEEVILNCVLISSQKGLSSGAVVTNLKLQSEELFNSKAK